MANNKTSNDSPFAQNNWQDYSHKDMKQQVHVSSLKIFDGEDLSSGNRKRLQQLQQKDWIDQQVQEKQERKQFLKETHQNYDMQSTHINNMALNLESTENQKRRDQEVACKQFNQQQTFEKFDKTKDDSSQEQSNNQDHIQYCSQNDFQTENTKTCDTFLQQHTRGKYLPYHWKGLNEQEQKKILQQQEQQMKENDVLKEQKKKEDQLYALQDEHLRFMNINLERERQRQQKQKLDEMKEYNLLAAKEQKLKVKTMYD